MAGDVAEGHLLARDVEDKLASLRGAVVAGWIEVVAAAAHSLQGTGGYLGARRLVELCTQLESLDDVREAGPLVDEVERVLQDVLAAVEEEARRAGYVEQFG